MVKDGFYGLGGVSFRGEAGAHTDLTLKDATHTGLTVSFLRKPGGGIFEVIAEGRALGTVDTKGPVIEPGFFQIALPPKTRHIQIRVSSGQVRAFGVRFEKPGPGVQYDSLGLNGAFVSVPARMFDEQHWVEQLRRLRPTSL